MLHVTLKLPPHKLQPTALTFFHQPNPGHHIIRNAVRYRQCRQPANNMKQNTNKNNQKQTKTTKRTRENTVPPPKHPTTPTNLTPSHSHRIHPTAGGKDTGVAHKQIRAPPRFPVCVHHRRRPPTAHFARPHLMGTEQQCSVIGGHPVPFHVLHQTLHHACPLPFALFDLRPCARHQHGGNVSQPHGRKGTGCATKRIHTQKKNRDPVSPCEPL